MDRIAQAEGFANRNDYQALAILRWAQHEGHQLTVTDLAAALGDTTATTANRTIRLQDLGYVERSPHPTDRRSVHITITKKRRRQRRTHGPHPNQPT
ncbi:MAG: MarR family transcriptional regulator [Acidimicrobiia bacterium]|nr:MarR family transcriptional regulator [Acidimicrobiia bacterium]MYF83402.1 MarR family transcriptional regulator [Acidimicrobiia bacterium]